MNQQVKRKRAGSVSFTPRSGASSTGMFPQPGSGKVMSVKAVEAIVSKAGEWKFVDSAIAVPSVSTTASLTLLNGLALGTTASTRIGRKVRNHTIELKLISNADSTTAYNVARYALVVDRQANGAAPAFTDIYDAAMPTALRNVSNKERFIVLWDSGLIKLIGSITGTLATQQLTEVSIQVHELYKKWSFTTQYNAGNAGTIADIATNSLYFVAIGNQAAGTADSGVQGSIRVRYTDE